MDHRYFVSEDNYITALEYTFKRKMRRPNWLAFRFICTFGQLLLCVACVLDGSFKGKTAFFIIGASLVLFGLSSIYFRGAKMQAKADFRRMMNRKQIPEDFWKQHTLRLGGGKIRLKYGKKDFELDNWLVKAVEFRNSVLLLSGGNVVDIIPTEALNYNSEYIIEKLRNERLSGAVQTAAKAKKELPEEKERNIITAVVENSIFGHSVRR